MTKFIKHITLQTAHTSKITTQDISEKAFLLCKHLIDQCLATDEAQPIPAFDGFYLHCERVPLNSSALSGAVFYGNKNPVSLIRFVIVKKTRHAVAMWRAIHTQATLKTKTSATERVPGTPFIAVSLEKELDFYPDAVERLKDFERCLALSWVYPN